jgi:glutamate--cysteine ligase regulatory subunit
MGGATSALARTNPTTKSNIELTAGLRSNMEHHRKNSGEESKSYKSWTESKGNDLFVPSWNPTTGLLEERQAYDITVKLFYLPNVLPQDRCQHTRDAIDFVLKELNVPNIDLLIVSFPDVTFDADDESSDDEDESKSGVQDNDPAFESIIDTWHTLESLQSTGLVTKLGLAEFGTYRLTRLLAAANIRPSVDQINIRDCCVVPKPLILMARQEKIELFTHNDSMDILPSGTLRELLSGKGIEVLQSVPDSKEDSQENGMPGQVAGLWVVKYTAVVSNRGVVENKGYFAAAKLEHSS